TCLTPNFAATCAPKSLIGIFALAALCSPRPAMNSRKGYEATEILSRGEAGNDRCGAVTEPDRAANIVRNGHGRKCFRPRGCFPLTSGCGSRRIYQHTFSTRRNPLLCTFICSPSG